MASEDRYPDDDDAAPLPRRIGRGPEDARQRYRGETVGPLGIRSGANPNNRDRQRQADGEGADDHQGECEKRICLRAHVVY